MDAAVNLVSAMTSTKELQQIEGWRRVTKIVNVSGKVYGIEVHFVVKGLKTTKGYRFVNKEDNTIIMMGYKCLTHQMSLSPHEIATADELDALTFWTLIYRDIVLSWT